MTKDRKLGRRLLAAFREPARARHLCGRHGWQICAACRGRIHERGCTSRPRPDRDCCERRHAELHAAGHVVGLDDLAIPMLPYSRLVQS